jgi:hypothetical protein
VPKQRLWRAVHHYSALLMQTEAALRRSRELVTSAEAVLHQARLTMQYAQLDEDNHVDSSGGHFLTTAKLVSVTNSGSQIAVCVAAVTCIDRGWLISPDRSL